MKKTIKKLVKSTCELMTTDRKTIEYLTKIEKAFKKSYKVTTTVRYIDSKYKDVIRPGVNGFYSKDKNEIIVFISGDIKRETRTLLHELTHAYQCKFMTKMFVKSTELKKAGKISYRDSWHETHARHCANLLANTLDFNLDLRSAFDYSLAA